MITNIDINNFNEYMLTACRVKILLGRSKAVIWYLCVISLIFYQQKQIIKKHLYFFFS